MHACMPPPVVHVATSVVIVITALRTLNRIVSLISIVHTPWAWRVSLEGLPPLCPHDSVVSLSDVLAVLLK